MVSLTLSVWKDILVEGFGNLPVSAVEAMTPLSLYRRLLLHDIEMSLFLIEIYATNSYVLSKTRNCSMPFLQRPHEPPIAGQISITLRESMIMAIMFPCASQIEDVNL